MALPPSPPEDPPAPAETENEVELASECPRCRTPYELGQEYCLECGLRLPVQEGIVAALGGAWRRRMPWYPGDWIWPVLLGLVIAAGGAAAAIVYSTGQKPARTFVATPDVHPTTTTTTAPEPPTSSTGTTRTTTTKPPPPPPPPPRRTVVAWPRGKSGYTVVLTSVPAGGGRSAATAQARRALGAGLAQVGVLDSSLYSSLHPGYFVVFSGVYDNPADAQAATGQAHVKGYSAAYARRITP
jgi:hypothetical protein